MENVKATTIDPYDYFTDEFIYADPFGVMFYDDSDFLIADLTLKENMDYYYGILDVVRQVYDVAAFVCFFGNLPHLFFLTRKELRTNLVYIVMIGICICDLLHGLMKMAQSFMMWHIVYPMEKCSAVYPYYHVWIDVMTKTLQIMSRRCSGVLGLFIAGFRAFSVLFPMSNAVNFMMKPTAGAAIVLTIGIVSSAWSAVYYKSTKIVKVIEACTERTMPSYVPYRQNSVSVEEYRFHLVDGYITAGLSVAYVLVTLVLLGALAQANRRRKQLKSENKSGGNTSAMIAVMAVSVFASEFTYGAIFIASNVLFYKFDDRSYFDQFEAFALTLSITSSIIHCFICFFMSSQYRDTVKRFVCTRKDKENKAVIVEPSAAHPSTVQTTKTSNASKRTY